MVNTSDILNSLSDIIYAYDAKTKDVVYMNEPAKELFGDCGKAEELFSSDGNADEYKCDVKGRIYAVRQKETEGDIVVTASDVTSYAKKKNELEKRLEREHIIVSCILEMHKNKPFKETIEYILQMISKFLEADKAYLFEYNGETISNTYRYVSKNEEPDTELFKNLNAHIIDRWMSTFTNGECVVIEDIEDIKDRSPEGYKLLKEANVHRLLAAPIYVKGKLAGFIGIDNLPSERLEEGGLFFEAIGDFVSMMIVRDDNEQLLRKMSYTDTLTNIYNRNKFIKDCEAMAEANETNVGVVYMDLNGLKEINDKRGHHEGDKALINMAEIISDVFEENTVYRVGGDEFVVFCHAVDETEFNKQVEALKKRLDKSEYKSAVGSQYAGEGSDIQEIIKIADENMYKDKMYFYRNSGQSKRYRARNDIFASISTADRIKKLINEERFVIWFQPRFTADGEEFCGSEALIRFFGEDDMIVSPMDFIPELEDNETIHLIDFYVFRHVCEYLSGWIESGKNVKPVSMNISHVTLRKPNFIESFMEIWYDYNVPKELIIIEVSENQDKGGISDIIDVLTELKKCGFQLAVDNFGSKYADLYLFADLKFDILKLDGDMVYKIETDKKTQLLSMSITQICHNENIRIVAERVENEQELEALRQIGCDEVQGYLFDKPMSWNWFEEKYL